MATQKPQHLNRNIGIAVGIIVILLLAVVAGYYMGIGNNSVTPSPTPTPTLTPTATPTSFPTPTPFPTVNTVITSVTFNNATYAMGTGGQSESIPDVSMVLGTNCTLTVKVTDYETANPSSVPQMFGFDASTSGENGIVSFATPYYSPASSTIVSAITSGDSCILTFNVHAIAVGIANPIINIMPSHYGYSFQNATLSFRVTVNN
jgi:hypothetical protein